MASKNVPTIRHATEEDIPTILSLIRELAIYEKALDAVHATPLLLSQTISFDPSPTAPHPPPPSPTRPARCLLLTPPHSPHPVALALYFYNYSTWRAAPGIYLEDLFVQETSRRKGYGGMLLAALAKEVLAVRGARLEWSVLKWNQASIDFYEGEGVGAEMMGEWVGMRVDGEALVRLAGREGEAERTGEVEGEA